MTAVTLIFLASLLMATVVISKGQAADREQIISLKEEIVLIKKQLKQNQEVLAALVDGNGDLATSLQLEQATRVAAEVEAKAARVKLLALEQEVTTQRVTLEGADIAKVIREWSPRVARLTCETEFSDGGSRVAKASAVADLTSSGLRFVTNKHVVEEKDLLADDCELTLADGESNLKVLKSGIEILSDRDLAYLKPGPTESLPAGVGKLPICSARPAIGEAVVILGYPSVGSKVGITATEGIIAGFDEEYYITSAKIERGNSGGAAILVKDNCFVGLPTLTVAGRTESLARILPVI